MSDVQTMDQPHKSEVNKSYVYEDAPGANLFKQGSSFRAIALREQWVREGVFGWKNDRVSRLCHVMGITLYDLSAMVAMFNENGDVDTYLLNKFWRNNYWPPYIGVMLTQLERHSHDRLKGA